MVEKKKEKNEYQLGARISYLYKLVPFFFLAKSKT